MAAPIDNNAPRSRGIMTEPTKSAVPKAATSLAVAAAAVTSRPAALSSRAFGRDENDHNGLSVRRYFTKLMISGGQGQRLRGTRWEFMPVEHFFLTLNTQMPLFNPERQPCSQGVATVAAAFAGFIWE